MKARFVVTRSTRWANYDGARHFLQPLVPEFDGEDDDPVATVLFDVALGSIPQEFEFCQTTTDKHHLAGLFGEEGIEIVEQQTPVVLSIGDIVDIDITVVGQLRARAPEDAHG